MTMEPSDAETCLHVSISEANMSSPVRGMTMCHAPLDVFDYLQLCCLVVMIRVWGGHLLFLLRVDVLSMMLADRRVLFCDFGHTFRLDGLTVYGRS